MSVGTVRRRSAKQHEPQSVEDRLALAYGRANESWVEREARQFNKLNDPEVRQALEVASAEQREAARIKRLRDQMREQDKRKKEDPTVDPVMSKVYVLYVWRECVVFGRRNTAKMVWQWEPVLFSREGSPSIKTLNQWRAKYGVADGEVVRAVNLHDAVMHGPGAAPLAPPSKRAARKVKQRRKAQAAQPQPTAKKKRTKVDPSLSCCDYWSHYISGKKYRCTKRAPWYVAYKSPLSKRRQLKKRCTQHAWNDRYFPQDARDLVRVARSGKKRKHSR